MGEIKGLFQRHRYFIVFFGALYLLFLHPLLLMQKGFTQGDYELQFYPWSASYAQALKAGHLLLWTPLIQSGFPLFAEGQTGMLYPLNLIFFRLLPFKIAYNTLFLSHFLMGGVFTYIFAQQQRFSKPAATLAALSFTFGSAYAGCFYNIVTMRSLVWFPLALYCVEKFLEKRDSRWLAGLTLVMAQSWLGGFPQTALYHALFVSLYYLIRRKGLDLQFVFSMVCAVFIALPQLWATFELAGHSARILQEKGSTMWGLVAPWAISTVFMYPWGAFMRATLYIGIFPLLALVLLPDWKERRVYWVLTIFGLLLSMGALNYLMIHVPGASLLRNPAKFLFFPAFFLAMIGAGAYDSFAKRLERIHLKRLYYFLAIFFILALGSFAAVSFGEGLIRGFGEWYVQSFVINKTFHRDSPEGYAAKIRATLDIIRGEVNASKFFFWAPFLFAAAFSVLVYMKRSKRILTRKFDALFLLFVVCDLFLYGRFFYGAGFIGNVGPFPSDTQYAAYSRDGKWLETVEAREADLLPNRNMPDGPAQAGAYSPLLDKNYYQLMKESGSLDDAFGRVPASDGFANTHKPLLDFMGVKHLRLDDGGRVVRWDNVTALEEYSYVTKIITFPSEREKLAYLKSTRFSPLLEVILDRQIAFSEGGRIQTRNQVYDRGWRATVDGKPREILRANHAFQAVILGAGEPPAKFEYRPDPVFKGAWVTLLGLVGTLALFLRRRNG